MKKRPTIADVARAAGVSLMTVSRVVNDKPGVGEETRQRIRDLVEEMGYRPNEIARGLVTRQTLSIGLVVPDIAYPFFAQIARGAEDAAFETGYSVFLLNTAENIEREISALDSLHQKEIDGVILCSSRLPSDELVVAVERFPAVALINREIVAPPANVATLNVNDSLGARLAIQHFVAGGRARIALAAGPAASTSAQRRIDGYRAGLRSAHLDFDPEMLEFCTPYMEGGYAATELILARRPRVDAIFAFNDLVAIGAIQACQDSGRRVPDDIAVIGVDDTPLAAMIRPRLTTLHTDLTSLGRQAMEAILTILNRDSGSGPLAYQLDPRLVVRESA